MLAVFPCHYPGATGLGAVFDDAEQWLHKIWKRWLEVGSLLPCTNPCQIALPSRLEFNITECEDGM